MEDMEDSFLKSKLVDLEKLELRRRRLWREIMNFKMRSMLDDSKKKVDLDSQWKKLTLTEKEIENLEKDLKEISQIVLRTKNLDLAKRFRSRIESMKRNEISSYD